MDGLIYLLNQAGIALAQANARIAELERALAAPVGDHPTT
jgi:hypothetical protein